MLQLHNIHKIYHDDGATTHALVGVSFSIKPGEFVSIMGPSGSGKSTLLHVLSFLDRPTGGSYIFAGKKMHELADDDLARIRNQEMGFIFQSFNLLSRSTVYENVELPLLYSAVTPTYRLVLVRQAVQAVGLEEKLFTEAGRLSGGQKQRVAIARALINNPRVIFADEPTGNLDSKSGGQIMEILKYLNQEQGRTILLVTHETYTAQYANRLIRLKDGRVERDEPIINYQRETFFK